MAQAENQVIQLDDEDEGDNAKMPPPSLPVPKAGAPRKTRTKKGQKKPSHSESHLVIVKTEDESSVKSTRSTRSKRVPPPKLLETVKIEKDTEEPIPGNGPIDVPQVLNGNTTIDSVYEDALTDNRGDPQLFNAVVVLKNVCFYL